MNSFFCSFFSFMFVFYHGRRFLFLGTCKLDQNLLENSWKKNSSKTSKVFISYSLSFTMLSIAEVQIYIFHFKLFIQHLMVLAGRSIIHKKKQNLLTPMIKVVFGVVVKVSPKSDKFSPLHNNSGWIWTQANERAKQIPIWHRRCFCSLIFSQESSEED